MEFIPPSEIASKVMTLLREAKKEIIIVSPYVNVTDWEKMKKSLAKAIENNVTIKFFVRKGTNDNLIPLKELGINPIKIENLHAKVYINENYAIATSQNIIEYSDKYSIDFGYKTKTVEERQELIDFVNTYIYKLDSNEIVIDEVENKSLNNKIVLNYKEGKHYNAKNDNSKLSNYLKNNFFIQYNNEIFERKNLYFQNCFPNIYHILILKYYTLKINVDHFDYKKFISYVTSNKFETINSYELNIFTEFQNQNKKELKYIDFNNITLNSNFEDILSDYNKITNAILDTNFHIL